VIVGQVRVRQVVVGQVGVGQVAVSQVAVGQVIRIHFVHRKIHVTLDSRVKIGW
jgi:hypothetical protein